MRSELGASQRSNAGVLGVGLGTVNADLRDVQNRTLGLDESNNNAVQLNDSVQNRTSDPTADLAEESGEGTLADDLEEALRDVTTDWKDAKDRKNDIARIATVALRDVVREILSEDGVPDPVAEKIVTTALELDERRDPETTFDVAGRRGTGDGRLG